jgi:hypothetical protein
MLAFSCSFSGKCYTGSLPLGSATSPIPMVRSFEISDLCFSFYIKLETLRWMTDTGHTRRKICHFCGKLPPK